jgi:hypothetical protein
METRIREKVKALLLTAGWTESDILEEQSVSHGNRVYRPDMILVNNLNPFAIVEVKAANIEITDSEVKNQILEYIDALSVPLGLVTNGTKIYQLSASKHEFEEITTFPTPAEAIKGFEDRVRSPAPYVVPPIKVSSKPPRYYQIEAINNAISSILSGNKRVRIQMAQGSGKSYVALQICWKLIKSALIKRVVFLSDREVITAQTQKLFSEHEWVVTMLPKSSGEIPISDVYFSTIQNALSHRDIGKIISRDTLIVIESDTSWGSKLEKILSESIILLFSSRDASWDVAKAFPSLVYKYSFQDAIADNFLIIPEGFVSRTLDEIAEIRIGGNIELIKDANDGTLVPVKIIKGRDLNSPDGIDFDQLTVEPKKLSEKGLPERFNLVKNDILMSALPIKGTHSVFLLSGKMPESSTFAPSLIRIRVKQNLANPQDVYAYLKSDSGQSAIKLLATRLGTSIPRISPSSLSQIPILLPLAKTTKKVQEKLSTFKQIKLKLQENIIPELDKAEKEAEDSTRLEELSEQFYQIANLLAPLPLIARILKSYPTPIALALRKYKDSRFNVYEQVLRLRDIFEATAFYVYNIVLADAFHRLDPRIYFVHDKGARRAFNGYSMTARLDFIDEIIGTAMRQSPNDLFMPQLVNTTFVAQAKDFQENYRNRLSHSATATESQQQKVLVDFEPVVMNMLSELEFITKYRLVRVPMFHFQNEQWKRRMEIYHGVVPEIDEQTVQTDGGLIPVDRNHLVLLDEEDQPLCLHPLYQVLASDETRNENHLCFFKQRKKTANTLEGESVQGAFEVKLNGYAEFENLQSCILESI